MFFEEGVTPSFSEEEIEIQEKSCFSVKKKNAIYHFYEKPLNGIKPTKLNERVNNSSLYAQ